MAISQFQQHVLKKDLKKIFYTAAEIRERYYIGKPGAIDK